MSNRNYKREITPALVSWAASRETDINVAAAIHAIADRTRSADDIWTAPTHAEYDHVRMALAEYVSHGDAANEDSYPWGEHNVMLGDDA